MTLEILEKRLAPAGIVSVILSGGALKVTGDGLANSISIEEISEGTFKITGIDAEGEATQISFNGTTGSTFDISSVTKGLAIDLKDGSDLVALSSMSVAGNVSVQLGGGNNGLTLDGVAIVGDLAINGLTGNDSVTATETNLNVTGKTTINLGDGANSVTMALMSAVTFGEGLSYTGGAGLDNFSLDAVDLTVGGAVDFKVGAGGGAVAVMADTANIQGALSFTSLNHLTQDSLFLLDAESLNIAGSVTIKQGNGVNSSQILADTDLVIGGSVSINHGNGASGDDADGSFARLSSNSFLAVGGSVTVVNGTGENLTLLSAETQMMIGGKVAVSNGNGEAITTISGGNIEIGDSLSITNKNGTHISMIDGDTLHVAKAITIVNGNADAAGENTTTLVSATHGFHAGSINITNGTGNFLNSISMTLQGEEPDSFYDVGTITSGITIKNGNSGPSGSSGGTTVNGIGPTGTINTISGDFKLGGNLAITNGNGGFANLIGGDSDLDSFYIGGGIALTNGNANGSGFANYFEAAVLTVNKGITIKNGASAGGGGSEFGIGELTVLGAVSITNGNNSNSNLLNIFEGGYASLGSLTIKNGNGERTINVCAIGDLTIGGALSFTTGNNTIDCLNIMEGAFASIGSVTFKTGNSSAIVNDLDCDYLTVTGAVSITNGNLVAAPTLGEVDPETSIMNLIGGDEEINLGSLTIKNGNGDSINDIDTGFVLIQGALSISSSAQIGKATIHSVSGDVVSIGGPISFATNGGDTINVIDGGAIELGSSLTLSHGSGDDFFTIGSGGSVLINGNVTAKLGEGDTMTDIGGNASLLTVAGTISVSALGGDDEFNVVGDGRVTGGITGSFGVSDAIIVDIGGSDNDPDLGLNVGGVINLTASANATLEVNLEDGSFGAITLTGGNNGDAITIQDAHIRGAMKIDLKGGNDNVSIDDSTFFSSLTILTGDGNDTVAVEGNADQTGASRFLGAVNINLGADNDTLSFNAAGSPSGISFYSSVILDGGAGDDAFNEGSNVRYYGMPSTVTSFGV